MSEDLPDPRQGATGARPGSSAPSGPKSLDPRSKSCWIPALVGIGLIFAAWMGIKRIEASAGPWALEAARNALSTSGLGPGDRGAIEAQITRLDGALSAEQIDGRSATRGVDAMLQVPLMQLLTLIDARDRMLPGSKLTGEEAASASATLGTLASYVDAEVVGLDRLNLALGPLATELEPGQPRPVATEDELRAIIAAAAAEIEAVPETRLDAVDLREVSRELLLQDLTESIDGVLAGPSESSVD